MSRRCRASLLERSTGGTSDSLSTGCSCARIARGLEPPPCVDPVLEYGYNMIRDSGFETQLATFGGGPRGDEIPRVTQGSGIYFWYAPFIFTDFDTFLDADVIPETYWAKEGFLEDDSDWRISDENPFEGVHHARRHLGDTSASRQLQVAQYSVCGGKQVVAGVVEPGDLAVWSVASMIDTVEASEAPRIELELGALKEDFSSYPTAISQFEDLTTTYQRYELSTFMNEGSKWMYAWVDLALGGTPAALRFADVDATQLVVYPTSVSIVLCAQFNFIVVVNSTAETEFL